MPLLGKAAMVLSFDIVADALDEHDDWHTHEHLPERLSIPGFLRGSRWVAQAGQSRYFVMYEVDEIATLASAAYLERLNQPTPWTAKMMTHYRGMTRGLCLVTGYGFERLASLPGGDLSRDRFESQGASAYAAGTYRMEYSLSKQETK